MSSAVKSSKEYFDQLQSRFQPENAKGVKAIFQYEMNDGNTYHAIIDNGILQTGEGVHANPDVIVKMNEADFVALVNGELNGIMAFMTGKMKVSGNLMLAQTMQQLFS